MEYKKLLKLKLLSLKHIAYGGLTYALNPISLLLWLFPLGSLFVWYVMSILPIDAIKFGYTLEGAAVYLFCIDGFLVSGFVIAKKVCPGLQNKWREARIVLEEDKKKSIEHLLVLKARKEIDNLVSENIDQSKIKYHKRSSKRL